jgi:hypothetical protein
MGCWTPGPGLFVMAPWEVIWVLTMVLMPWGTVMSQSIYSSLLASLCSWPCWSSRCGNSVIFRPSVSGLWPAGRRRRWNQKYSSEASLRIPPHHQQLPSPYSFISFSPSLSRTFKQNSKSPLTWPASDWNSYLSLLEMVARFEQLDCLSGSEMCNIITPVLGVWSGPRCSVTPTVGWPWHLLSSRPSYNHSVTLLSSGLWMMCPIPSSLFSKVYIMNTSAFIICDFFF